MQIKSSAAANEKFWVAQRNTQLVCWVVRTNFVVRHNNIQKKKKKGKSEGFDSCDRPSNLTEIGFESLISQPVWPRNLMDDPEQGKSEGFESCDRPIVRKRPIWVKFHDF